MAFQMKDFTGSIFNNDYKNPQDPNDKSPHFKGRCVINGQEWSVAAWWSYPQNGGNAFLSLKFEPPRQQQQYQQPGYPAQPQPQYQQPAPAQPGYYPPQPAPGPGPADDLPQG